MTTISTAAASRRRLSWQMHLTIAFSMLVMLAPDLVYASGVDNQIGNVFCTVRHWFTGNVGKGLATIAITIVGIGALLGKVSWGMAMIVGIGIAIIFGTTSLVDTIGGGVTDATNNCNQNASGR